MSPELTQKLLDVAPNFYLGRHKPLTENLMAFGFECGDGWFELLYDASEALESYVSWRFADLPADERPMALQVKEKYGTLRFYTTFDDYTIHAITQYAEHRSEHTCETCGDYGRRRGKGWVYTACDEHTHEGDKNVEED